MNSPGLTVVERGHATPVAYVLERDGQAMWASRAQATPSHLISFLMPVLSAPRETVVRTVKDDGSAVLRIEQVNATQRRYWEVVASSINFAPHSTGRYYARVVDTMPIDLVFRELPAPVVWCDMLAFSGAPYPDIHCTCSATYAYGTKTCPGCGGDDPMVHLFSEHYEQIEAAIRSRLSGLGANELFKQALTARAPLLSSASRDRTPPEARPEDKPNDHPRRLDAFFRERLALSGGSRERFKSLQLEVQQSPRKIAASAASAALAARRMWRPDAEYGWLGSPTSLPRVAREVAATWETVPVELAAVGNRLTVAIARFAPVHHLLNKDQSLTWGKAARWALTAVSAAKTLGANLVLKAVMAAVRDEKQRKVVAAFETALSEADEAVECAASGLLRAAKEQEQHDARMRSAAQSYMGVVLAWDYAYASAEEQLAMTERLAESAGVSVNRKALRKRGSLENSHIARLFRTSWRGTAACLLALAAAALVAVLLWSYWS